MRKHNGMRPQDIVVLLKIVSKGGIKWFNKDLAQELFLSQSEISESINRSKIAGLLNQSGNKVHTHALLEFIQFGLQYVFPVIPEGPAKGLATAHSHPIINSEFAGDPIYVWPDIAGNAYGLSITPFYKDVVKAVKIDARLYEMLALIDVLRIGRVREIKRSRELLKEMIKHESTK